MKNLACCANTQAVVFPRRKQVNADNKQEECIRRVAGKQRKESQELSGTLCAENQITGQMVQHIPLQKKIWKTRPVLCCSYAVPGFVLLSFLPVLFF